MKQMKATPANTNLPVKIAPYTNLVDALEYAAQGDTGFNFYDGRGHLSVFCLILICGTKHRLLPAVY